MKKKTLIKLIITIIVAGALLVCLQSILMPKYMSENKEGAMIEQYYSEYGGNDVIFIGDCEVYENVSPVTMWENYGITSYIRGSAQQLMWHSYYILEDTLKYEKPKVVVFNVLAMMYGTNQSTGSQDSREAYNRMTLDGMRWSSSKWNAIQASLTNDEQEKNGAWSYIFPILRYHDRIFDLKAEDFKYMFSKDKVTDQGYLMQVGVNPVDAEFIGMPLADYTFSQTCYDYLDKIRELCEENDIELMLMKAPSLSPVWYDQWEEQIVDYAEKYDLLYVNFLNYQDDIGIDWNTDTYDKGLHLNVYGTEKLSEYLGNILVSEYDLEDHRSDSSYADKWEIIVNTYDERKASLENAR